MVHTYPPEWNDMSDYVVHFTRDTDNNTAYDNIMSILYNRVLCARNPFGYVRDQAPNVETQNAICLSEVPLHLIDRISNRRGVHGIGFFKRFLLERGGGPIWFVEQGSSADRALNVLIQDAQNSPDPDNHPIWTITPYVDRRMPNYRFEWEREWRHVGDLHFDEQDVAFLVIPENLHGAARAFFENAREEHLGPAYLCPYIDVGWSLARIQRTLEQRDQGVR